MRELIIGLTLLTMAVATPAEAQHLDKLSPVTGSGCAGVDAEWQKLRSSSSLSALRRLRTSLPATCMYYADSIDTRIANVESSNAAADTAARTQARAAAIEKAVKATGITRGVNYRMDSSSTVTCEMYTKRSSGKASRFQINGTRLIDNFERWGGTPETKGYHYEIASVDGSLIKGNRYFNDGTLGLEISWRVYGQIIQVQEGVTTERLQRC